MNKQNNNTSPSCPNCDAPLLGQFCSSCGQVQKRYDRFFLTLVVEALEGVFEPNSKSWKTVIGLLFKPGYLSQEYLRGRRARYIQPIRLYFITSIMFFLTLTAMNFFSDSFVEVQQAGEITANAEGLPYTDEELPEFTVDEQGNRQYVESLELPWASAETNERYRYLLNQQVTKAVELAQEDPRELISVMLDIAPPIIFCLLPVFALLLKIIYAFKGMYYSEHLILAIHNHCFIFIAFMLMALPDPDFGLGLNDIPQMLIMIWIPSYLLFSLKRVYQESWGPTIFKFIILAVLYGIVLFAANSFAAFIGLLTL